MLCKAAAVSEPTDLRADSESYEDVRAERDALRQELADLRAWLSLKLNLVEHAHPAPKGSHG